MLRLKVEVATDGSMEARGILGGNIRTLHGDKRLVEDDTLCETW